MKLNFSEMCDRYNKLVVSKFSRAWSYTGGSPKMSSYAECPAILRRLMIAETALARAASELRISAAKTKVDAIRTASAGQYWITVGTGAPELAVLRSGKPASARYARTLARWRGGVRLTQQEALREAKQRLAECDAREQSLSDLMQDLLGTRRLHHCSAAELWPDQYGLGV